VADVGVPGSVQALLGRRLAGLRPATGAALRVAAALGARFRFAHLAAVLGAEPTTAAVDEAVAVGLVAAAGPGRYRFAHPLIGEVVLAGLGVAARAAVHERVADALAGLAAAGGGVEPGVLAAHFREAVPVGRAADAVRHAVRAAEAALVALGYEDAVRWYRTALDLLDLAPGAAGRGELLVALSEAQRACGDPAAAAATGASAAAAAEDAGEHDLLALAALAVTGGAEGFEVPGAGAAGLALLEQARAAQPAGSALWVRLTARLAVALTRDAPQPRRTALAGAAVAAGRALGAAGPLAAALAARCDTTAGPDDVASRSADAAEVVALAGAVGDVRAELLGRRLRLVALLEAGDVAGADVEVGAFERRVVEVGQPLYAWYPPLWRSARALMDGRVEEAERLLDRAAAAGERAGSDNARLLVGVARWLSLLAAGAGTAQYRLLTGMAGAIDYTGTDFEVSLALSRAAAGQLDSAADVLDGLAEALRTAPVDAEWLAMLVQATELVALVGGHRLAAWLHETLLPHRTRHAVDGIGAFCHGSVERPLGTLAALLGRPEAARAHFAAARAAHVAIGAHRLVELTDADERRALGARSPAVAGPVFRRDGETWSLGYAGTAVAVRDSKGMADLAALLARPGTGVPAVELAGVVAGADLGEVVDAPARAAYRERLAALDVELAAADEAGDRERSMRADRERVALLDQLGQAYGMGGRARRAGRPVERARSTVTWRIREAIRRIEAVHPELGRHLRNSVRTGAVCSYEPETPVRWAGLTS
jgi:hypothetical protein